jgi:hypothetical protein
VILNKQLCLILLFLLTIVISNCNKCPDSDSGNTYNVNQADLPYIIPYTDSSKVRFLKNGTDTLTFISQGLKNEYTKQFVGGGNCGQTDRLQQLSLIMKCKEGDFFEIKVKNEVLNYIYLTCNNYTFDKMFGQQYYASGSLTRTFIKSMVINNISYDSVQQINDKGYYFIVKPKFGILKISTNDLYELIK